MASDGVRMVCFDAGGVLVRICRSWREGCDAAGVEFRWSEHADATEGQRRLINDDFQRGLVSGDDFFSRMAGTTGGLYTAEEIRAVHDVWILDEYDGVGELVERLNAIPDLHTGLLSNTNASHWSQALMFGGRGVSAVGRVAHPHASHLLGLTKPDPQVYRAFERETGAQPAEILFFDDLEENIVAARAAGWRAELIDYRDDTTAQILRHLRRHGVDPGGDGGAGS